MGFSGFLGLEGEDLAAFAASALLGYFAGTFVPNATAAIYTSILVSYHLFLGWLVVFDAGRRTGVPLPWWQTLMTHAACMVVVLGPVSFAPHRSSVFLLFRYGIAAMAFFEQKWLFTADEVQMPAMEEAPAVSLLEAEAIHGTAQDAVEWNQYLAQRPAGSRLPGVSLKDEYEQWLVARRKSAMDRTS